MSLKLSERLNVIMQATLLAQKNGALTFDDAVNAKSSMDIITSGTINQNFTNAITTLIEIVISSQKKGVYSLKDAHMLYLAIEGIEGELQNEVNRLNEQIKSQQSYVLEYSDNNNSSNENIVIV